jgi:hypothetical protein
MPSSENAIPVFPGFDAPPEAQHCVAIIVRGGEFRSADFVFPISDGGMNISGGIAGGEFLPSPDGSNGLYGRPLPVPGGATSIDRVSRALGSMGNATARVEAVKPLVIHDLLAFDITLFLRIQVQNSFVGGDCYIGTPEAPLTVRIHRADWDREIPALTREGVPDGVIAITNIHGAASGFKVPAVSGAGPMGVFNTLVNVRAGLPNRGKTTSLRIQADAFLAQNPGYGGTR